MSENQSPANPGPAEGWENEGGSLTESEPVLPPGVLAIRTTHYAVGPYRYAKLDDALAELSRQENFGAAPRL